VRAKIYHVIRDLHLYLGLFISPFVLVFSVSVFFLVHAWRPGTSSGTSTTRIVEAFPVGKDWQLLSGRPLIEALKPALEKAGVHGEVGFIRHMVQEQKLIIPVEIPGRETTVTIRADTGEASIVSRDTGLADALVALHKSPGPHGPEIRMNWTYMRAWRWLADATVYLILFISVSGVYLWYVLRAERRIGVILLVAGGLFFFGMTYALSH